MGINKWSEGVEKMLHEHRGDRSGGGGERLVFCRSHGNWGMSEHDVARRCCGACGIEKTVCRCELRVEDLT